MVIEACNWWRILDWSRYHNYWSADRKELWNSISAIDHDCWTQETHGSLFLSLVFRVVFVVCFNQKLWLKVSNPWEALTTFKDVWSYCNRCSILFVENWNLNCIVFWHGLYDFNQMRSSCHYRKTFFFSFVISACQDYAHNLQKMSRDMQTGVTTNRRQFSLD